MEVIARFFLRLVRLVVRFWFSCRDLNADSFSVLCRVSETIDDELSLCAVDSHKRKVLFQINMPDFNIFGASHIVYSANQRVRLDMIALAHAEEQTHHVRVVVHLLFFLLFFAAIFAVVDVQILGIFVIIEEAVEV